MIPLNNEQKRLLFDYSLGLTRKEETDEAEALISSNIEAAEISSNLKDFLKPLDNLSLESCPDSLIEKTILRVNNYTDSSQSHLQQLLTTEQNKRIIRVGFKRNLVEMAAVAALIIFFVGVLVPTLSVARQRSWRQICKKQMANIFQGLRNYISDYDGQSPAVASTVGAPWWKVGDQGSENHSNTRHIYLLPKGGYVEMGSFVCPGSKGEKTLKLEDSQIKRLKDFPGRIYVTYSFQIRCNKMQSGKLLCRKVLMADWNPIFERQDFSKQLQLRLNRELLTLNSNNHNRRGQNVLFGDGSVEFLKTRFIGISEDDIYTLQDTDIYQGCEVPSCETDFFLAP